MIIKTDVSTVETVGDVKEYKTSIDPKNLEFITTLLSSNLYSFPERSFIREIVSNAWDAHVEAGTTDTPVILTISDNSVLIRDYGTGLSPERFNNVFCNIGSSTKRDSNKYLGAFGIGRFASLSCSNIVNYTSYYNGVETGYIMLKDGNNITINEVYKKDTEEKNGLQVEITGIKNMERYLRALDFIIFFPNIYVDYKCNSINYYCRDINNVKIKYFTNFAVASTRIIHKLLLGNVLYPCDTSHLNNECSKFINLIERSGVVIKFDIGTLKVTPNREEIIYDSDTIKIIEDKILKAKEEIKDILLNNIDKDYNDIFEYYRTITGVHSYNFIQETLYYNENISEEESISFKLHHFSITDSITFLGKNLDDTEIQSFIKIIAGLPLPNIKSIIVNNTYTLNFKQWRIIEKSKIDSKSPVVFVNDSKRFSSVIKSYLEYNYNEYIVINKDITESEFVDYILKIIHEHYDYYSQSFLTKYSYLLTSIYNNIIKRSKKEDFTSQKFLDYKDSYSIKDTKDKEEVILYCSNIKNKYGWECSHVSNFTNLKKAIKFIKGAKEGVVINNIDRVNDDTYREICKEKGYGYITANAKVIKELNKESFTNRVSLDFLLKDSPLNRKLYTILFNFNDVTCTCVDENILRTIPQCLRDAIRINVMNVSRGEYYQTVKYLKCNPCPLDPYIYYLCQKYIEYRNSYLTMMNKSSLCNCYDGDFKSVIMSTLLCKNKSYRISKECYLEFKHNSLINLLYARKENNN